MKEDTIEIKRFEKLKTVLYLLILVLFAVSIVSLLLSLSYASKNKAKNRISFSGEIEKIAYDEIDKHYSIHLKNDENIYYIFASMEVSEEIKDKLKLNDLITISATSSNKPKMHIVTIEREGLIIASLEEYNLMNRNIFFSISAVSFVIGLATLFLRLYLGHKNFTKTLNVIDFMITNDNLVYIYKSKLSLDKIRKKHIYATRIFISMLFVFLIMLIVLCYLLKNKFLTIIVTLLTFILASLVYSYFAFDKSFYRKKEVPRFVEKYKSLLLSGEHFPNINYYRKKEFSETKFKYEIDGVEYYNDKQITEMENKGLSASQIESKIESVVKVSVPYNEISFYAIGRFMNNFQALRILICARIDDFYFVFDLQPEDYQNIIKYNVKVDGLNYLIDNMESEIYKAHKQKLKMIRYNNY